MLSLGIKELLVVELKKGRARDSVVGQIQRYMGYIKDEIVESDQIVKGVIVAFEDDQRIKRALSVTNDKIERNPCKGIKRLKDNNKVDRWLDIAEERKLIKVMPERFQLLMAIALNTGLRMAEQMGLQWDDIDFRGEGQITIRDPKSEVAQYQPMNPNAFKAFKRLKEMPSHISRDVFYWINQSTGSEKVPNYNKLRYLWGTYCKKAGVKKSSGTS